MHRIKKQSPLNYAFSVGKIRALEKFLITGEAFEKAIESDIGEALKLFVESDLYSDELLYVKDSRQLEEVLSHETSKLKRLMHELILDKGLLGLVEPDILRCIADVLKTRPGEFLEDYFMHLIDMHNIKTFLRLYILKEPAEKLDSHLSCEGFMKKEVFLEFYDKELTAFLNKLEYVHRHNRVIDYAYFLRDAIEKLESENSFVALEKAINDFLIDVLKPAKYLTFGPEPVLAYYFAKQNEINLIRMIIMAKLNAASKDLIRERLNNVYA